MCHSIALRTIIKTAKVSTILFTIHSGTYILEGPMRTVCAMTPEMITVPCRHRELTAQHLLERRVIA